MRNHFLGTCVPYLLLLAGACGSGGDANYKQDVTTGMKALITTQLDAWLVAAQALQVAAPLPTGRGWDKTADGSAIAAMKTAWVQGREAYERIEGSIAETFPDSDVATDARYDDFLQNLRGGDSDLFDDQGVTGMHAVERILYSDQIPAVVVAFEQGLPGYVPAAYPATAAQADEFKNKLVARMVMDIETLRGQFKSLNLDLAFVFTGLRGLVREQKEKVQKTATGEEESRYAQATLRDLRANYQGCFDTYGIFRPWIRSKPGGPVLDQDIITAFTRLRTSYDAVAGDAIPLPPATWSSDAPSAADLQTPFGMMYVIVNRESDSAVSGSLSSDLDRAGNLLGLH